MSNITFEGQPVSVSGNFPSIEQTAPNFTLCDKNLGEITLDKYKGKKVVLNIFPSIDTPVCANSVKKFNTEISKLENTEVICISADLPFASTRFCTNENLNNVSIASFFRNNDFTQNYGVKIEQGLLKGLAARAVIVIDENGKIIQSELVPEITQEPDYNKVLNALQ